MDNSINQTQTEPVNIQPVPPPSAAEALAKAGPPQKSKLPIVLVMILLLFVFVGAGVVLGKFLFTTPTTPIVEKLILPTPSPAEALAKAGTPTTEPTIANWKTYTNTSMGIQFKYPANPKWNIKENTQGVNSLTLYNYDVDKAPGRSYAPEIDGDIFKIEISKQKSNLTANDWLNQQKSVISPVTNKPEEFSNIKTITVDSQNGIYYETKDALGGLTVGGAVFKSPDNDLVFFFGGLNFQGNKQVFNQILSTLKFLEQTQVDQTTNWQTFTSPCSITIKYPQQWKARTSFIPNAEKNGDPKYDYDCAYITALDYTQGMDNREGFYLSINGTTIGTMSKPVDAKINPYPINTIDDYIKSVEDSVMTQPEPFKAKNIQTKTYGTITGKFFETSAMEEHANFVFLKGNGIYNISWSNSYNGQYKNSIDLIIGSIK